MKCSIGNCNNEVFIHPNGKPVFECEEHFKEQPVQQEEKEDFCHGLAIYTGEEFPDFYGNRCRVYDDHSNPNTPCYKIVFEGSTEEIGNIHDGEFEFITSEDIQPSTPIVEEGEEKNYLIDKKAAYSVYVAGFNHGFNEKSIIPEYSTFDAFKRLMKGESPCLDGSSYDIPKHSLSNREEGRELQRPNAKDYFDTLTDVYLVSQTKLFAYAQALDRYIDAFSPSSTPLEQKELKDGLTNAEYIEVAKICGYQSIDEDDNVSFLSIGKDVVNDFIKGETFWLPAKFMYAARYLESKGYKL